MVTAVTNPKKRKLRETAVKPLNTLLINPILKLNNQTVNNVLSLKHLCIKA
jgi:hypothetical protein